MVLAIFDWPFPFNPLVHDDSLLHKFIILYWWCTMMQLPRNQFHHHPVKDGCVATSQRWTVDRKLQAPPGQFLLFGSQLLYYYKFLGGGEGKSHVPTPPCMKPCSQCLFFLPPLELRNNTNTLLQWWHNNQFYKEQIRHMMVLDCIENPKTRLHIKLYTLMNLYFMSYNLIFNFFETINAILIQK